MSDALTTRALNTAAPVTLQPQPHDPIHEESLRASAALLAAEIVAVPDSEVIPLNLDVTTVVGIVNAALVNLARFDTQLAALPGLDMGPIRKLPDYANALLHWQASTLYATTPSLGLTERAALGIETRERVLHDLGSLVRHGVLDGALLKEFGDSIAHRRVGLDLVGLANLVHDRWDSIGGRSLITLEDMDMAATLGREIVNLCRLRDAAPTLASDAVKMRDKAYTLVVRAYNQARAGMIFVRREEGDVDTLVPSLWVGRGGSKKRAPDADITGARVSIANPADAYGDTETLLASSEDPALDPKPLPGSSMLFPPTPKG